MGFKQMLPDRHVVSDMRWSVRFSLAIIVLVVLAGCGNTPTAEAPPPDTESAAADTAPPGTESEPAEPTVDAEGSEGTLQLRANGEDFVRQGFVTADGWNITFDNVYVTLANITAYQADPPFDADAGGQPEAEVNVTADQTYTVDLAEGDENAETILIDELTAPAGRYNAISWEMVPATDGPSSGAVITMMGNAQRDGETINFTIQLDRESTETCGDFVGDERKGILEADATADLEATFHFDHIFGDGEAAPDDEINTGALGFDPFAALAEGGTLVADPATLQAELSAEDYEQLQQKHLAHVGEGHCNTSE